MTVPQRPVAVLAYGSLLHEPGPVLAPLVTDRIPCRTPFPVEYGRASARWGGGPVLVPHPWGAPVDGALLRLADGVTLGEAVEALRIREGLPGPVGVVEVVVPRAAGWTVICASLPRNLDRAAMAPAALARRAVASAARGERNGVAYLADALASGIVTPRSRAYAAEVGRITGCTTLEAARAGLLRLRPFADQEGADGLG